MGNASSCSVPDSDDGNESRVIFTSLDAQDDSSKGSVFFVTGTGDQLGDPHDASVETRFRVIETRRQPGLGETSFTSEDKGLVKRQNNKVIKLCPSASSVELGFMTTDGTQVSHKPLEVQVDLLNLWRQWTSQHPERGLRDLVGAPSSLSVTTSFLSTHVQLDRNQFLYLGEQLLKALQTEAQCKKHWRATAAALQEELKTSKAENIKLFDELARSTSHNRSLMREISDLNGRVDEWRCRVQELEEELKTSKKEQGDQLALCISKSTSEKGQLMKRLQDLSRSAHHQKTELLSLRSKNQELKKSLNSSQQQILFLESRLSAREADLERLTAEHATSVSLMSQSLKQQEDAVQGYQQKAALMQNNLSELERCNVRLQHNLSSREAEVERLQVDHKKSVSSMMRDLQSHGEANARLEKKMASMEKETLELELRSTELDHKLAVKDKELEACKAEHRAAVSSMLQDLKIHEDAKLELDEKASSMQRRILELELQSSTFKQETAKLKSEVDVLSTCKDEIELMNRRLLHQETTLIQMRTLAKRLRNEKNELLETVEVLKSANDEQQDSNSSQVQALAQKLRMAKSELAVWKERCLNQNVKFTSTEDIECSASAVTGRLKHHRAFSKPASPSLSYSAASIPSHPQYELSEGTNATFSTAHYSRSQGGSRSSKRSRRDVS